jgi:regulation of enolase protein 1 (concanavalin A-like superfamily)
MATDLARIGWGEGQWLNPPVDATPTDQELLVTAAEGGDFWRTTSYGFVHDNGHALLRPLLVGEAVEVSFILDYDQQFDQAGVFVRASDEAWAKAGVEISDGAAQVGAVVTFGASDWSVAPVANWVGSEVTVRVSRGDDALTIRATGAGEPWRLVRLAPWLLEGPASAGPYCCAPTRPGLQVRFTRWVTGPADAALHGG